MTLDKQSQREVALPDSVSSTSKGALQEEENGIQEKDHAIDSVDLEGGNGSLSRQHRDYLVARHGTFDLVPLPTMDPADPLNWPAWKVWISLHYLDNSNADFLQKNVNLFLVAFHAMMTTFTAASVIPAFENFAEDFNVTITKASYITSVQIVVLAWAPLFWKPISNRFGRRPIWLISTLGSLICNIGCSKSHSYASQIVSRFLVAFFISPAIAISSVVVTETFFARERGEKMGIWTLMVTLG